MVKVVARKEVQKLGGHRRTSEQLDPRGVNSPSPRKSRRIQRATNSRDTTKPVERQLHLITCLRADVFFELYECFREILTSWCISNPFQQNGLSVKGSVMYLICMEYVMNSHGKTWTLISSSA